MRESSPSTTLRHALPDLVLRAALFAAMWWVLAGGVADSWKIGVPAVMLALGMSAWLVPPAPVRLSLVGVGRFIGFFLVQSLRGGLQVARLALRPKTDLQPVEMELPLRLAPGAGQLFLASSLCLMPGTLAVSLDGSRLRLHVLDKRMPVEQEVRALERRIAHMFGEPLR